MDRFFHHSSYHKLTAARRARGVIAAYEWRSEQFTERNTTVIDPSNYQLYQALYQEQLQAAAAARQRRATWVAAPSVIDWLRQAIGTRLIRLGQRMQMPAARASPYR
jgi:hypothetical protein